ncbi:MAG: hypothetical protein NXH75_14285, partial [Halobacteriovoraceae bacterium]|nr:hypothetical protein [Halobacteriovoraceae bacterium]
NETKIFTPKKYYEFWDFGTLADFKEILGKLKKEKAGKMGEFLVQYFEKRGLEQDLLRELEKSEVHDKFGEGKLYKLS